MGGEIENKKKSTMVRGGDKKKRKGEMVRDGEIGRKYIIVPWLGTQNSPVREREGELLYPTNQCPSGEEYQQAVTPFVAGIR